MNEKSRRWAARQINKDPWRYDDSKHDIQRRPLVRARDILDITDDGNGNTDIVWKDRSGEKQKWYIVKSHQRDKQPTSVLDEDLTHGQPISNEALGAAVRELHTRQTEIIETLEDISEILENQEGP
jgi:hypothetical protein